MDMKSIEQVAQEVADEWYWADERLISWGYAMSSNTEVSGAGTASAGLPG